MLIPQTKRRIIFHIDMNCFYASVEMAYHPTLKGKPLAIAGNPEERKGIIVTSSYEARAKGVYTTMPVWKAKQLCPTLKVMRPNFRRYRAASKEIFKILAHITPLVEPVSIDEGYMDVTDVKHLGNPIQVAQHIQQQLIDRLDLPCSIGIAPNKFLAKMASDMKKPMGLTILRKRELHRKLWPMPIEDMHGVGEKTAKKLHTLKIQTIGDLAKTDVYVLKQLLGINGERLKNRANGIDSRRVNPDAINDFKSIGHSKTFPHDTTDLVEIRQLMYTMAESVEQRLKSKQVAGRSVQLMIRYHNLKTITRRKTLNTHIAEKREILQIAQELWEKHWNNEPVRLLGITVQDLVDEQTVGKQLDLFTYKQEEENDKLHTTIENSWQDEAVDVAPKTSFQKDFLDDYKR
ncbi:MAG TPA: DNA polymerase IV [Bacillota bacterium]